MFAPVETYEQLALLMEIENPKRRVTVDQLTAMLRRPADLAQVSLESGELPVFAHGGEIVRVVPKEEDAMVSAHLAVQTWSALNDRWVTQKSYPVNDEASAIDDARSWYPVPSGKSLESWVPYVNGDKSFESRDQLAAFMYAVKPFSHLQSPEWAFKREVAVTAIERAGIPRPELPAHEQARIIKVMESIEGEWFEPPANILRGLVRMPNAGEHAPDVRFVQYSSVEAAADDLLSAPCSAILKCVDGVDDRKFSFESMMPREMLLTALRSFVESGQEHTYMISVCAQHWDAAALEAGETSEREMLVECETVTPEELGGYARRFGLSVASASSPQHAENIWFSSTAPDENQAYFEQGIHTFYDLHVHAVDGREQLVADDYREVATLLGVKFRDHEAALAPEL